MTSSGQPPTDADATPTVHESDATRTAADDQATLNDARQTGSRRAGGDLKTVAGYTVVRELARGGMGVVYEAFDPELGRDVAIKVLRTEYEHGVLARERFRAEAQISSKLRHPHLVTVYAFGFDDDDTPYLVMELIRGQSLKAKLAREGPLPFREAAEVIVPLARALHAAHQAGILHRDVKPANVLLDAEGQPRLSDFGIARHLDGGAGLTITGQIMGTPAYMSPEQADGQSRTLTPRADVYGLGATLYELLTGRPPFGGVTPLNVLQAVINTEVKPPRSLRPAVPSDLERVCLTCLHKAPGDRYASAAALAEDLERFLESRPVAARAIPLPRRLLRSARRNALALTLACGFLVAAAVGVAQGLAAAERERAIAARDAAREAGLRGAPQEEIAARLDLVFALEGRTPPRILEAAQIYSTAGHEDRARELLEEVARDHPPAYAALLALHRLELARSPTRAAVITEPLQRLLARAKERGEVNAYSLFARGEAAHAAGRLDEAISLYTRIERFDARFPWGYVNRSAAHYARARFEGALADAERALEIDETLITAWVNSGNARSALGDSAGAVSDYTRAVTLDPTFAPAHLNLGIARRDLGDGEGALQAYSEALRHAPELVTDLPRHDAGLFVDRGERRLARSEHTGALDDFSWALKIDPDLGPAYRGRGQVRARTEDLAGAREDFEQALSIDPGDADAFVGRANLFRRAGDRERALRDCASALVIDPTHAEALRLQASLRSP